ncbi:unnamed protein product [Psylliodes chrysocephalus]|uniref:BESS domain-containing protein n=1 Tax=Psylliodes chrysocephalus TaxID=3402493 RepID=A0A9P0D592_9CUCU|nr:unnamed protein product [Psylliodes chrysocephala]
MLHDNDFETNNNNGDNAHNNDVSIENDGVGTQQYHVTNKPTEIQDQTSATSTIFRRKRKRLEEKLETYIDNYQLPKAQTNEERSDDMDFFRSLLPIIAPLTMSQKIKVRMEIMKLLLSYTDTPVPQNIVPSTSYASNAFLQQSSQFRRHDGQQQYIYSTSEQPQVAEKITKKQHFYMPSQPPSILTQLTPQHHRSFQNITTQNSPPTLPQLTTPSTDTQS